MTQPMTINDYVLLYRSRCEESFFPITYWTPLEYGGALAGETGELCNLLKKLRRDGNVDVEKIKTEMADVFAYLCLIAARLDVDLQESVKNKFNEVSDKVGSSHRIT